MIPFVNCYVWPKQRGEVRDLRGIPGRFCGDLALVCCCGLCTLVQEAQEAQEYTAQKATLSGQALPISGLAGAGTVVVTHTTVPVGYVVPPADQQMHPAPGQQYAGQQYAGQQYPPQQYPPPQYEEKGQM